MNQRTINKSVTLSGVGLHTGMQVTLTFHPAPANHGFKFKRVDLVGLPVINADVSRVKSTMRGTTLGSHDAEVSTVEHVLSALVGLQIDNVLMDINGPEVPIMDGSALRFVQILKSAGITEQPEPKDYFEVKETIVYKDEQSGAELIIIPADELEVTTMIDFNSSVLSEQFASFSYHDDYEAEIAPCRTFVFLHELEMLFDHGLIRGGNLDNAIVIANERVPQEKLDQLASKLKKESVSFNTAGILNDTKLHYKNELARHKLLDVLGDIALLGKPIKGKIVAKKPGHGANVAFTKVLKKKLQEQRKLKGKPQYDPNTPPLFNTQQILEWLPHRHPFLLVDKIIELSANHVVGVKSITFNESFFQGHFPNNPVFPGVLQIEALAQTGGILALSTVDDPGNWDTYFLKIENARFKNKIVPGDTLLLKMELMAPIRRGICQMYGTAYVGNKIVSEAELTAQIVKRS